MQLWHYTCAHRARLIGRRGVLKPHPQPLLGGIELVWLTDLESPDRDGLGLTSTVLACDRTECRYRIEDAPRALAWTDYAEQAHIDRTVRSELTLWRKPRHWFVSTEPVAVTLA